MAVVIVLLVTSSLALAPLAESGELLILATYPDSDNFSSIQLSCVDDMSSGTQSPVIGAKFKLNGTDIKEEIDEVEDFADINGTVHFVLTQEKEGFFTCSLNESLSTNSIGLAAQPSNDYSRQSAILKVTLPYIDSTVSTELQCDIQPGALRQRYSVQWSAVFHIGLISNAGDMFNLKLTVLSSTNGSQFQCHVTIDHDGNGTIVTYEGRLTVIITSADLGVTEVGFVLILFWSIFCCCCCCCWCCFCCWCCCGSYYEKRKRSHNKTNRNVHQVPLQKVQNVSLSTGQSGVNQNRPEYLLTMCDLEHTQHREECLIHKTQILVPTSGPPIELKNSRKYIPNWFSPVATLSQCTHNGRCYDEHNDFGLDIPAGAIPEGETITIDIGVALYGPFLYPEGLRPVSPVFWVCVRDQKDFQFLKPVKVTIPYYLNLKHPNNIKSLGLTFLKGDHEMNSHQMYQLQQAEGGMLVVPLKKYSIFKTTHLSPYCISSKLISYPATATSDTNEAHHDIKPSTLVREKLSLSSTAGLAVDQAKLECFGEIDEVVETNFENTQNKESLTHSRETQILLPTSGPPIDPDNTREHIPACFSPVATLSQCTHDGRCYHDDHNEFGLEIPAGAIPEGETITIDIGVALYGPFQYPEGLRPVSPVFWVCVRDQKDYQFLKPVKVTIPHCLNLENHDDIESLGLTFLKGDHKMNTQQMYQFQQVKGFIEPLKNYGEIQTTHFCSHCISDNITEENIQKTLFCISAVFPTTISVSDSAYFFVTFLLNTCLKVVDDQINKDPAIQGHNRVRQHFQFSSDGEDQTLEIVLPQSLPDDWQIGLCFADKISVSDIDFFGKEEKDLKLMEEIGTYPPRFRVAITCGSPTARPRQAKIEFKGAKKDLVVNIYLNPSPTSPASISSGHSSIHRQDEATTLGENPTMPKLLHLKIPQKVGSNYYTLGIFLLNDQTGSRVSSFQGDSVNVVQRILQEWLEGRGLPVTWESLTQTLRDTELTALADEIPANLLH